MERMTAVRLYLCNCMLLLIMITLPLVSCKKGQENVVDKSSGPPENMVLIPAGSFMMGSDKEADERPIHSVYLDSFYIDKFEVTNREYKRFCDSTGREYPEQPKFRGMDHYFENYPDYPVVRVNWEDAKAYAEWAGKRLPTEAEWEKAARGGFVGKRYPWGIKDPNYKGKYRCNYAPEAKFDKDGYRYTAPVGSFEPNGYGIYDMAGNVCEWTSDWYDAYPGNKWRKGHKEFYGEKFKVTRGGSYIAIDPVHLRCANRFKIKPEFKWDYYGFRCAKSIRSN